LPTKRVNIFFDFTSRELKDILLNFFSIFCYLRAVYNPNKTLRMILYNSLLIISAIASAACYYYYLKEKKLLKHFIQHSRRHTYNKEIDTSIQQRARRYLSVCVVLTFVMLPLLVQNFVEGFIENNWKWLATCLSISLSVLAYKNITTTTKSGSTKWFSFSFNRNATE